MSYVATAHVRNLRDPRLTLQHKAVLMMLADRHQMLGKTDWPSLPELAAECAIKKSWLCDLLGDLTTWKLLIRSPGGGRNKKTSYEVVGVPAPFKQSGIADGFPEKQSGIADGISETVRWDGPPYKGRKAEDFKAGGENAPSTVNIPSPPPPLEPSAIKLLNAFRLPETVANVRAVTASIQAEIKDGKSAAEACEFILAGCKVAQSEGYVIDLLFFNNAKYRVEKRRKPNRNHGTKQQTEAPVGVQEQRRNYNFQSALIAFGDTAMAAAFAGNGKRQPAESATRGATLLEGKIKTVR